jgi:ABC-2 type transport system permease protein
VRPWIDYANARNVLFNGSVTSEQWQQLAVSGTIWFLLPLAIGLLIVRRAEVK